MGTLDLEFTLISAQGLRPPSGLRRVEAYSVIWIDPEVKLRSIVDHDGGENPTWNDKFVFRVPSDYLGDDSASALNVEIYATEGWYRPDSLVGSVRLLLGNLRLLSRRRHSPVFEAVGIRRPSGRLHGVLNVGAAILKSMSSVASEALLRSPATSFRDLMKEGAPSKSRRLSLPSWVGTSPLAVDRVLKENNGPLPSQGACRPVKDRKKPPPLPAAIKVTKERKKSLPSLATGRASKEGNRFSPSPTATLSPSPSQSSATSAEVEAGEEEMRSNGPVLFSLFPRKIHASSSDSSLAELVLAWERSKN